MARGAGAHLALNGRRRFTNVAVHMQRRSPCHRHKFEAVEGLVGLRMHETQRSSYAYSYRNACVGATLDALRAGR
jgi:hypothetical protein